MFFSESIVKRQTIVLTRVIPIMRNLVLVMRLLTKETPKKRFSTIVIDKKQKNIKIMPNTNKTNNWSVIHCIKIAFFKANFSFVNYVKQFFDLILFYYKYNFFLSTNASCFFIFPSFSVFGNLSEYSMSVSKSGFYWIRTILS